MAKKNKKTLVLIDSNALVHRAFHALPPLSKKDGTPTGAVYGYALTLLSVMEQLKPDYIAATFDLAGPTFRHEKFEDYKATRVKAPDELYEQIPLVKKMLEAYGIPIYEKQGFEADDVIGTLAKNKKLNGDLQKIIVTGDLDALQLVDNDVEVFTLRKGIKDTVTYNTEKVKKRFDLDPEQIVDYKALRGDASDNIPGVKGIGEKTATELLKKYKTLDSVYKNIEKITSPPSLRKKLEEGKKSAFLSRELAEIKIDVPVEFDLADCGIEGLDAEKLANFFQQTEFYSLYKRMKGGQTTPESSYATSGQADKKEQKLEIIHNQKKVDQLISKIEKKKTFSFDVLASDEKYYNAELSGVGIAISGGEAFFVSAEYIHNFKKIFVDKKIEKIGFNVKFDLEMFWKNWFGLDDKKLPQKIYSQEIEKAENFFDVQLAAYLLGKSGAGELEKLIFEEFGAGLENAVTKSGQGNLLNDTGETQQKEAAEKAAWIFRLYDEYKNSLEKEGGTKGVYEKLEEPLIKILAKMEIAGVKMEKEILKKVSQETEKEIGKLEKKIHKLAGEEFNINSPIQLAPILYEKLQIPTTEIRRGKTGYSTGADELRKVRDLHPIISLIEKYRELFKIKTTYADALLGLVEDDGRIHAHFNQAVAATGRLSSSDPNMQNIPKRGKLADVIRSAFVSEKGKIFVSADYSQIDLRVAAHLSDDPKLIDAFEKGKDIHRATASWVNGIPEEKLTDKQRNEAKSLNFGILYGMGIYGFMRDSGVSQKRAKYFIDQYMKTFSGLKGYIEKTKEFAQENGYVETEMGRRRYIPNIKASNVMIRRAAERMAVNLPIQGLAADIMKLAMVQAEELLKKYNKQKVRIALVLQIHDELIFEVDEGVAKKFSRDIKKTMESVYKLKVPLVVDVTSGSNWKQL